MSKQSDRAREFHDAIREILLHEWDPIGVSDVREAVDEYDGYVGEIYGLLIRNEPKHKLVDHLWWLENSHMGLCGYRPKTEAIADRLIGLREDITGR